LPSLKKIIFVLLVIQVLIMVCAAEEVAPDDQSMADVSTAQQLTARFAADVTSGMMPLTVYFTDKSTGSPALWKWDFGDGATSFVQNPVHVYTKSGKFTVVLKITKGTKSDQLKKAAMITVRADKTPPPGLTDLQNSTNLPTLITWTWTDPAVPDFSHVMVYVDNEFRQDVTANIQTFTGMDFHPNTRHKISTRTVDSLGNMNRTWVNHTARTAPLGTVSPGWMFRANPEHTGVYDDGGIRPTGQLKWKYPIGNWVQSTPAVANGVIYAGNSQGGIYAINADTGILAWEYTTGNLVFSSPAVVNGIVYVGSYDHNLYALDAGTGTVLWKYTTEGEVLSSPAVANGVVYVGSWDKNIYALNANTGALLWKFTTGDDVSSSPAVADGVVYVGSDDHAIYALDAGTGALLWKYTSGFYVASSPAVANGNIYVGSFDGYIYALNAKTGILLWKYDTKSYVRSSSPAVADGIVYVGCFDHNLYALDAGTGALLWRYPTGDDVSSSPAVANGIVYVGSGDNNLYALDAKTGAFLWDYTMGDDVKSSPAVANGVVYVGSGDGNIYAIK
jgi:outer membrane protein assembly factor BamB